MEKYQKEIEKLKSRSAYFSAMDFQNLANDFAEAALVLQELFQKFKNSNGDILDEN